jgi:hypothetical protein
MAGRHAKPIDIHMANGNPSHLTHEEIEDRKNSEIRFGGRGDTDVICSCPEALDGRAADSAGITTGDERPAALATRQVIDCGRKGAQSVAEDFGIGFRFRHFDVTPRSIPYGLGT